MSTGALIERTTTAEEASTRYAWYVVGVLTLIYTVSFIDRQLLTLLFTPIKHDLHLTDTEVSVIAGFAFALFYAILGVPIAMLADRYNRVALIAAGMTLWSVMTTVCGFARGFWSFFLARVGVGVGETALSPSAYSIIADYFPPQKLGKALSVYTLAIYFGMGSALLLGSVVVGFVMRMPAFELPLVGAVHPWQLALMLVGAPGVLLAAILLTVREPRRRSAANLEAARAAGDSVFRYLGARWRIYAPHFAGFSLLGMLGNGIATWTPEFFLRKYGIPTNHTALVFGLILIGCGGPGILLGGWYADRRRALGQLDAPIRVAVGAIIPLGICASLMPNVANPNLAFALLAGVMFCFSLPGGLAPASLQMITPGHLRARVSAVYLFFTTLIGTGCGPTVVALFTDHVFHDDAMLGRSLTVVALGVAPLGLLLILATLKPFRVAAQAAQAV